MNAIMILTHFTKLMITIVTTRRKGRVLMTIAMMMTMIQYIQH